jgi:hypothetical protein
MGIFAAKMTTAGTGSLPGPGATPREVCESYWRAESSRNLDMTLQHFLPEAIYVAAGKRYIGLEEIRGFYTENFRSFPHLDVALTHAISEADEAALEWRAVLGDSSGNSRSVIGINVVHVQHGKFKELRAYFDPAVLSR